MVKEGWSYAEIYVILKRDVIPGIPSQFCVRYTDTFPGRYILVGAIEERAPLPDIVIVVLVSEVCEIVVRFLLAFKLQCLGVGDFAGWNIT
jgi:hypothetical protein